MQEGIHKRNNFLTPACKRTENGPSGQNNSSPSITFCSGIKTHQSGCKLQSLFPQFFFLISCLQRHTSKPEIPLCIPPARWGECHLYHLFPIFCILAETHLVHLTHLLETSVRISSPSFPAVDCPSHTFALRFTPWALCWAMRVTGSPCLLRVASWGTPWVTTPPGCKWASFFLIDILMRTILCSHVAVLVLDIFVLNLFGLLPPAEIFGLTVLWLLLRSGSPANTSWTRSCATTETKTRTAPFLGAF